MATRRSWVSASDLADYAFCPRSYWYREHPPEAGASRASQARAAAGQSYHQRTLAGERRRAEHPAGYWAALAIGVLLVLGAMAWIFHP